MADTYALPSPDQLFPGEPQSGPPHDAVWSAVTNPGARILNAVGYGAKDAWGARPLGLDQQTQQTLSKLGVFNDWKDGHENYLKSFNEAVIRPAAQAVDFAARTPGAVLGAIQAGSAQLAQEIQGDDSTHGRMDVRHIAAMPFGVLSDVAEQAGAGAIPELPELGIAREIEQAQFADAVAQSKAVERVSQANEARAYGVVGEGEAGFYGAEESTPENVQARTEAAQDAGLEAPPPPEPPAPDIHALARRIDPDTFERYDALALERDTARDDLNRLASESREERPEVIEARRNLNELIGLEPESDVRGSAFEERLQAMAASAPDELLDRVADAYDRLDSLLTEDTPEMAQARGRMMDADLAMREMAPDVSNAYRAANDMLPAEAKRLAEEAAQQPKPEASAAEKPAAEGEGQPKQAPERTPAEQAGADAAEEAHLAPVAASPEAEAEVAPGSPTGDQKLGDVNSESAQPEPATGEPAPATEPGKPSRPAGSGAMRTVEGTGETKVRGLARGVEAKAIEEGLAERFGNLPEYNAVQWKEQIPKAQELVENDYEHAKAVAMGQRAPPEGLLRNVVFGAVERKAFAEGDIATLQALGTRSKLLARATTMGQEIAALGLRDRASPVDAIAEVQSAREAYIGKKTDLEAAKRATVDEIRAEVKRAAKTPKAEAWSDFLSSIKCSE